jgi:valine--pyruvate aminotransferase
MKTNLSVHGIRMSRLTGVRAIMEDIRQTQAASPSAPWINLSPGNPVILPAVEAMWREHARAVADSKEFGDVVCRYGESQGYPPLLDAVANLFNSKYNWGITPANVLITPGSQSLLFAAANCFCGYDGKGTLRKLLLPLSPDYTGYDGICLNEEALTAVPPHIEIGADHTFKYGVDFEKLSIDDNTGAVMFSRPCNPSGNVIRTDEVEKIIGLAQAHDAPVFIDAAYGPPFPNLAFARIEPFRGDNVVYSMSMSKAGLPGERIGIAVGPSRYLDVMRAFLTNAVLHSSRFGQAIAARAIASGELVRASQAVIGPYYRTKFELMRRLMTESMPDIDWYLHKFEGALFAWLWLKNLPISDLELYNEIKQERVFVVPGSFFFPGTDETWKHRAECLRVSLTATDEEITKGVAAIARVAARLYKKTARVARAAAS